MNLQGIVGVVLPVFAILGLGYALVRLRILPQSLGDALGEFVFVVPIPFLLFRAIATLDLRDFDPWALWGAYFCAALAVLFIGTFLTSRVFGRDAPAAVIGGMCAAYANVVMVGIPLASETLGEAGLTLLLVLIALHSPLMLAVSSVAIALVTTPAAGKGGVAAAALTQSLRALARNPIILAILAGALYRVTGLPLEGVPRAVIDRVAETAVPLALMALGMSLNHYGISGNVRPAIALCVVKLALLPALVFVFARLFGLDELTTAVVVLAAAGPTGVNAYLLATRVSTGLALAANTITLSTAASVVTLTLWLAILGV